MKFLPINKLVKSLLLLLSVSQAQAAIIFNLNFTPDALAQYSVAEQQAFTDGLVFWDSIIEKRKVKFETQGVSSGLELGLELIGQKLIEYFPERGTPSNQLPNDISYGKV